MPYSGSPEQRREKRRRYRERHRDEINARQRQRRADNLEAVRAYKRDWRNANRERINAQLRQRRADDPERFREYNRRYQKRNRAAINERNRTRDRARTNALRLQRRRADPVKTRAVSQRERHGITPEQWQELWTAQSGLCWLCGEPLPEDRRKVHVDHDHRHCPPGRSCGLCRRGLACDACNTLVGLARDDPARLRRVADELERGLLRIDALLAAQPALFIVPRETYEPPRRPAPNGHRKDPDPDLWKATTLW
jgi:Recombination endonuclease VII